VFDGISADARRFVSGILSLDAALSPRRRQQPVSLAAADSAQILSLGEDLPKLWNAAKAVEREQILRLVIKEVILDQRTTTVLSR
jgi:hypothetical protein